MLPSFGRTKESSYGMLAKKILEAQAYIAMRKTNNHRKDKNSLEGNVVYKYTTIQQVHRTIINKHTLTNKYYNHAYIIIRRVYGLP